MVDAERSSPPFPRLYAAGAALALLAVAALAGFGVVLAASPGTPASRPAASPSTPASRPPATGFADAREIAAHVQERYRLADGRPMAEVQASTTAPVSAVVVPGRHGLRRIPVLGQVQYTICGPGAPGVGCALASRLPWQRRALLIRAQALELAVLTFAYVPEVRTVVVGYPTRQNVVGFQLFERRSFAPQVVDTLLREIEGGGPSQPVEGAWTTTAEIDRWTLPSAYRLEANLPQTDGTLIFVLGPLRWPLPASRY
jgi:hypothetical protein